VTVAKELWRAAGNRKLENWDYDRQEAMKSQKKRYCKDVRWWELQASVIGSIPESCKVLRINTQTSDAVALTARCWTTGTKTISLWPKHLKPLALKSLELPESEFESSAWMCHF
jgi:hypothetical protein